MRKRISQMFGDGPGEMPCVKTLAKDDLRVNVQEYTKACGHPGHLIEVHLLLGPKDGWVPVAIFGGEGLHTAIGLLVEAAKYIDGVRAERFAQPLADD